MGGNLGWFVGHCFLDSSLLVLAVSQSADQAGNPRLENGELHQWCHHVRIRQTSKEKAG